MDLTIDKSTPEKRPRLDDGDERPTSTASPLQKIALDLSSHNNSNNVNHEQAGDEQIDPNASLNGLGTIRTSDITFRRVLCDNPSKKFVAFEGEYNNAPAVVTLEKMAFNEAAIEAVFRPNANESSVLKRSMANDIYGNYTVVPPPSLNQVKAVIIHPATQKHIDKYSREEFHLVRETPELYRNVTEKFLNESQFALDWVYNILNHEKEADRIVCEDSNPETGFILIKGKGTFDYDHR